MSPPAPCTGTQHPSAETAPPEGEVVVVQLDDRELAVWWGPAGDVDRMATRAGQVLTWPTVGACRAHATSADWAPMGTADDDPGLSTVDCRPAQIWLRNPRTVLDPVSALALWNLQWDVVATRTGAYPALTREQVRCHEKLTVANVPWLIGENSYRPRWTAAELRCVRRALDEAVHVLRTEVFRP